MTACIGTRPSLFLMSGLLALMLVWAPSASADGPAKPSAHAIEQFGHPPAIMDGPLPEAVHAALRVAVIQGAATGTWGPDQIAALEAVVASRDVRAAWLMSDMMRFTWQRDVHEALGAAAEDLLEAGFRTPQLWSEVTNHLIAWDVPAYPGYLQDKRAIFTRFVPGWERIFVDGTIDWRLVSWGGVHIDDRLYDTTDESCNCIPAADNPEVSSAADATWLKDDDVVFGIVINGEARAYPRRIMEVREMVNDTLGGRHLGIPYCTLCGAAQAYFTDRLPDGIARPVLRTSGLLIRSNKVMYDINTYSVFDTFLGHAVTGPLAEKSLQLEQATVITTDWGTWKAEHPQTTVLLERYALGRDFDFRNGRDANGPIFPVGDVDPRLPVHEDIIGVVTASGQPVAFQRSKAIAALKNGAEIAFEDVRLELAAGGVRAVGSDGSDLGSHEAFWFAWSQFHPGTALWPM